MNSAWIRWTVILLVCCVSAHADLDKQHIKKIDSAVPEKARMKTIKPRKLLIWNTPFMDKCPHKGYSVPQAAYAMKRMGEKTGAYEAVISDDLALYLPKNIKQFDAILFNNSNGNWIRPTQEDMERFKEYGSNIDAVEQLLRKSFMDWLENGHGIVGYHHTVGGNTHWEEYQDMFGVRYWGHPWNEEVGVHIEEPDHALVAAFGGKDFRIADEIFQFRDPYSRDKLRVLLSLDVKTTNMDVKWIHRKDNDFALCWVKSCGKGRVFYSAIGHRTEIWWNPAILQFYLDGIQFAFGDLEADTIPVTGLLKGQ